MTSAWDPAQYEQFAEARHRPFFDLLEGLEPRPGGRAVDLGCGTGRLTRVLHERVGAARTLGIDRSETMLAEAAPADGLEFRCADLREALEPGAYDLIFSNAALHWVDDHPALFERLVSALRPGGGLAVQVPANHDSVPYREADRLAAEAPFSAELDGFVRRSPVLDPAEYSTLLDQLGLREQRVQLRVYPHHLESRAAVFEWISGTYLKDYEERMSPEGFAAYGHELRTRLERVLPEQRPFFFPFKRTLMWARK